MAHLGFTARKEASELRPKSARNTRETTAFSRVPSKAREVKNDNAMKDLLDALDERGREKYHMTQTARKRLTEAEFETQRVCEELMNLKRAQEHEVITAKNSAEKFTRNLRFELEREAREARQDALKVSKSAEMAEFNKKNADARVQSLLEQIAELQRELDHSKRGGDAKFARDARILQSRVDRISKQSDSRVEDVVRFRKKVCEKASEAMDTAEKEVGMQLLQASLRSEGRLRLQELIDVGRARRDACVDEDVFWGVKDELCELWHQQDCEVQSITSTRLPSPCQPILSSPCTPVPWLPVPCP
jgi:hypothetical protein